MIEKVTLWYADYLYDYFSFSKLRAALTRTKKN